MLGLFVKMPPQSISYIYQVQGCQHLLLPSEDDYAQPIIPALTVKGFARWQAIQILLDPQIHVPIIQFAVSNWSLKHPETSVPFPVDLPSSAFPTEPDPDTDRWHQGCADRLREEATPKEEPKPSFAEPKVPFSHVRVNPNASRDYFTHPPNVAYVRVSSTGGQYTPRGAGIPRSPERERERERERDRSHERDRGRYSRRQGSSSDEPGPRPHVHHRTRSFSDCPPPPPPLRVHVPHLTPDRAPPSRRHSQPRHCSSSSSEDEVSPRRRRRPQSRPSDDPPGVVPPGISVRHGLFVPEGSGGPTGSRVGGPTSVPVRPHPHGSSHPHSSHTVPPIAVNVQPPPTTEATGGGGRSSGSSRADDSVRKSLHDLKDKITSFLPGGERQRSGSRSRKDGGGREPGGGVPVSRLGRTWSAEDDESDDTDDLETTTRRNLRATHHSSRDDRGSRERDIRQRDRERDRERERDRDRDRLRDRDRDRERAARGSRDRYRDKERDRDRDSDERRSDRELRDRSRGHIIVDDHHVRRDRDRREHHRADLDSDDDVPPSPRSRTRGSGGSASGPYLAHADLHRRTSSHADIDRRRDRDWVDGRERLYRDRERDRELRERDRDREREGRWRREERVPRERSSAADRMPSPVVTGVTGRKYPTDGVW